MPTFMSVLLLLSVQVTAAAEVEQALAIDIFVSEPGEINTTSAIIKGKSEMMVVCAQPNISAATRLAEKLKSTGLELKYIFLTHAHLDHFQGASILLKEFPSAQFIATPKVASLQRLRIEVSDQIAKDRYGDNAAVPSVEVDAFDEDVLFIDGMTVELWHGYVGDAALGHPDEEHTVVYVHRPTR
jgi:glyoxylase-like metal-dependent hydrolase (beta-lactamase superfamily II)